MPPSSFKGAPSRYPVSLASPIAPCQAKRLRSDWLVLAVSAPLTWCGLSPREDDEMHAGHQPVFPAHVLRSGGPGTCIAASVREANAGPSLTVTKRPAVLADQDAGGVCGASGRAGHRVRGR
jgi:hypothetical protein